MALEIYTDGGARGNPGPAAAGVVIRDDQGRSILEAGYFLGKATNNVAEYTALLLSLEAAHRFGADQICVHSDSELMVKQLTGEYKVRDARLAELFEQAQRLLIKFESWQVKHIRREQNRRADALVNKAIDGRGDVVEIQLGDARPHDRPPPAAEAGPAGSATRPTPATRGQRSEPSAAPGAANLPPVLVKVIHPPKPGGCTGGTGPDQEFVFGETAPGGMCVYALKAVLDTVLAMRYAAGKQEALMPVRVRCGKRGCGAEFDIRLQPPTE